MTRGAQIPCVFVLQPTECGRSLLPGCAVLFNSLEYIAFLLTVFALYWAAVRHARLALGILLAASLIFYASCAALTWWAYTRRGGLLHDIERGRAPAPAPSTAPLKGATA